MNPRQTKNLIISAWNADNIKPKKNEVQNFLADYEIDIMLLSETWLRAGDNLKFANYITYREDRQDGPVGGVAILIKNKIKHDFITIENLTTLETIGIQIKTSNNKDLRIFTAYYPPSRIFQHSVYRKIVENDIPTIIMGDLNSKNTQWGCLTTNQYGRQMAKLLDNQNMNILTPDKPTFFGINTIRPDMLGVAIYKNISHHMELKRICDLSSGHNPIILTLGSEIALEPDVAAKKINWETFKKLTHENLRLMNIPTTENEIDAAIESLTNTITDSLSYSTSNTKP